MGYYILFSSLISVYTGWFLYSKGYSWTYEFMPDKNLVESTNKLLLILFYLLNIGMIFYSVVVWNPNGSPLWIYIIKRIGIVLMAVGYLHVQNILMILFIFYFKFQKQWKH